MKSYDDLIAVYKRMDCGVRDMCSRGSSTIGNIDLLTLPMEENTPWRVKQFGQNVKGPFFFLVSYLYLCFYSWHIVAQLTRRIYVFFSFKVLEGGLWENYTDAMICDPHVIMSGLH